MAKSPLRERVQHGRRGFVTGALPVHHICELFGFSSGRRLWPGQWLLRSSLEWGRPEYLYFRALDSKALVGYEIANQCQDLRGMSWQVYNAREAWDVPA